jgi:uncharacterized membrane protein
MYKTTPKTLWIASSAHAIIIGLALYLSFLSMLQLPCAGGGGCSAILSSTYSKFLGIPVGLLSVCFWIAMLFLPDKLYRVLAWWFLFGCIWFIHQMTVLGSYCPYCILHHIAAFCLAVLLPKPTLKTIRFIPFGFLLGGVLLGLSYINTPKVPVNPVPINKVESIPSLNPFAAKPESNLMVTSVTCYTCLSKLAQLAANKYSNPPRLTFFVTPENRTLTEYLFAAALSLDPKHTSLDVGLQAVFFSLDNEINNLALTEYGLKLLSSRFDLNPYLELAKTKVKEFEQATIQNKWNQTPLYLNPAGTVIKESSFGEIIP